MGEARPQRVLGGAGACQRDDLVAAPDQARGEREFMLTLSERGSVANTLTATSRVAALALRLKPKRAAPTRRVRFLGHEKVGAEIAERWLREMRFPSAVATQVATIVRGHMRLMASEELTDSALRRLVRDFGPLLERLLRVVEADALALRPGVRRIDVRAIRQRIDLLSRQTPPAVLESPLSGREIMELTGWSEGPQVGKAKAWLLERVLDGSLPPADAESARAALLQAIDRGELP